VDCLLFGPRKALRLMKSASMNEYVEISKDYSSPESGKFINGVVNNILKDLTKKNLLEKNERGSQ